MPQGHKATLTTIQIVGCGKLIATAIKIGTKQLKILYTVNKRLLEILDQKGYNYSSELVKCSTRMTMDLLI